MPQEAKLPRTSGFFKEKVDFLKKVLPQAAKLPRTSGFFKTNRISGEKSAPGSEAAQDKWFLRKKKSFSGKRFCPRQRSCPGQVASSKKKTISGRSSAPGSAAAPDKWLGRKKATNRCRQGRGARILDPGSWIQDPRSRTLDHGS